MATDDAITKEGRPGVGCPGWRHGDPQGFEIGPAAQEGRRKSGGAAHGDGPVQDLLHISQVSGQGGGIALPGQEEVKRAPARKAQEGDHGGAVLPVAAVHPIGKGFPRQCHRLTRSASPTRLQHPEPHAAEGRDHAAAARAGFYACGSVAGR